MPTRSDLADGGGEPSGRWIRHALRALLPAVLPVALLIAAWPARAAPSPPLTIHYVERRVERPTPLNNEPPIPDDEGLRGAELGLRDGNATGRFVGLAFALKSTVVEPGADLGAALANLAREDGAPLRFLVVNAPAEDVLAIADAPEAREAVLLNVGAPDVRLIVDANESWHDRDTAAEAAALAALNVEMVEQPVFRGREERLAGVASPLPLCADESCHTRADLDRLGDFDAVNIKLDKAGGLTEALALRAEARARGFRVMVGCMLGTSLGVAPAAIVAQGADWIDLDGALLLAEDRPGGLAMQDGLLLPGTLWGTGQ